MLTIRRLAESAKERPTGLIAASALDALIDGPLLGLGYNIEQDQGTLLAIAVAVEFLFLGLSISGAFRRQSSRAAVGGGAIGISFAVPLGALIPQPIGRLSEVRRAVAFAFGPMTLLYLVTEELLTEAHERPKITWGAAMFFVGSLMMIVVSDTMGS